MAHQAASVVTMGVGQEHVVKGNCRKRAFTHINAKIKFRNLDVRCESGNRKSGYWRAGRIDVDLSQGVVYILIFVHFSTAQ